MNTSNEQFEQIQENIWKLATSLKEENMRLHTENEILKRLVDEWVKKFEELMDTHSITTPKLEISNINTTNNKVVTVKMPVLIPEKTPEEIKKEKQREAVRKCREKKRQALENSLKLGKA